MRRHIGWLLVLGLGATGCKSEPPRYPTPTTTAPGTPTKVAPEKSDDPVTQVTPEDPVAPPDQQVEAPPVVPGDVLVCPGGTVLRGSAPPNGKDQWCAKAPGDGSSPKHGPARVWWPGGEKQSEGQYENGAMSGAWTWWHQNGQVSKQGSFVAGKKHGTWLHYAPDGMKIGRADFVAGKMTEQWNWLKEKNGKIKEIHTVMEGFSERMGTHDAPPLPPPVDAPSPAAKPVEAPPTPPAAAPPTVDSPSPAPAQ